MNMYKTLFISDIHLGTEPAETGKLLKLLKNTKFEKLYLVGDIIDMTNMKEKIFWKNSHTKVLKKLLKIAKKKRIDVFYIVGNHDYFLEPFIGSEFAGISICERAIHITGTGERMLVIHGHQFDAIMKRDLSWLYNLGSFGYDLSLKIGTIINKFRRLFGYENWSLANFLKHKVKNAIKAINNYEHLVVMEAERQGVDMVCCGHIHMANDTMIGKVRYLNTGCWTDRICTYIVENIDGTIELKYYNEQDYDNNTVQERRD